MRGIGSNANTELGDPAIAPHLDDVYVPRPRGLGVAFFDIERVEVNVGPQGTVRGRNALGGTINLVSRKPKLGAVRRLCGVFRRRLRPAGAARRAQRADR